jgi:hypothetical protein
MIKSPTDLQPTKQQENTLFILDTIIHCMMLRECFDYIDNDSPKVAFILKVTSRLRPRNSEKLLEPNSKKDYALVYSNGETPLTKL